MRSEIEQRDGRPVGFRQRWLVREQFADWLIELRFATRHGIGEQ
jgi:hypothetical protein